jgi:hypothetical protein
LPFSSPGSCSCRSEPRVRADGRKDQRSRFAPLPVDIARKWNATSSGFAGSRMSTTCTLLYLHVWPPHAARYCESLEDAHVDDLFGYDVLQAQFADQPDIRARRRQVACVAAVPVLIAGDLGGRRSRRSWSGRRAPTPARRAPPAAPIAATATPRRAREEARDVGLIAFSIPAGTDQPARRLRGAQYTLLEVGIYYILSEAEMSVTVPYGPDTEGHDVGGSLCVLHRLSSRVAPPLFGDATRRNALRARHRPRATWPFRPPALAGSHQRGRCVQGTGGEG